MTKELHDQLSGLEQDLSKLKVDRDMALAEVEEISATKRFEELRSLSSLYSLFPAQMRQPTNVLHI